MLELAEGEEMEPETIDGKARITRRFFARSIEAYRAFDSADCGGGGFWL
jgi:hypothetical protein